MGQAKGHWASGSVHWTQGNGHRSAEKEIWAGEDDYWTEEGNVPVPMPFRGRPAPLLAATAGVGLALLVLTGTASWSVFATYAAAQSLSRAAHVADLYGSARLALANEESLCRKYRLEPSPGVRREYQAARNHFDVAMAEVARGAPRSARTTPTLLVTSNALYTAQVGALFNAVDWGDSSVAASQDTRAVITFDVLVSTLEAESGRLNRIDNDAQSRLLRIEGIARWTTSLAVLATVLVIILFYWLRRRSNRMRLAQARLSAHQASHDTLTGLPNRGRFTQLLNRKLGEAQKDGEALESIGVVLLDLDRFKEINDTLGHHYGDRLLQQIGPRIQQVLRADEVMARIGGDEFAFLVSFRQDGGHEDGERHGDGKQHGGQPGGEQRGGAQSRTALERHQAVARRVMAALRDPFVIDEIALTVEASAGIAVFPEHGTTGEVLLQLADTAMYLAKANHEDIAVYDRNLDVNDPRKLALLSQLRTAINRNELVLHYQPLINIGTNELRGVEALVRWQHPQEGLLPPSEFIALAEGSGLIHELTRYVLRTACEQAKTWLDAGHPLVVSVNISARCLLDSGLPDSVVATLAQTGLPTRLLKLEITESAIISDPTRAQSVINRLHSMGVALSIDDFGTGYTSLAYLHALPVHELKIDQSFVSRMLFDDKDAVIVRTAVELATRLGLDSVAEGIEDAETLSALADLGCTIAQGYHLGHPMPAARFNTWLVERAAAFAPADADAGSSLA